MPVGTTGRCAYLCVPDGEVAAATLCHERERVEGGAARIQPEELRNGRHVRRNRRRQPVSGAARLGEVFDEVPLREEAQALASDYWISDEQNRAGPIFVHACERIGHWSVLPRNLRDVGWR